jgi:NAD-dependent deacetylase
MATYLARGVRRIVSDDLAALIRGNQPCVVLTGAGVSTESGIPDFRSPTGIWASFDPREYATIGAFRRDPEKVWRFYAPRFSMLADAEPNRAHRALAELESLGLVRAIVTQNIDQLHERAGSHDVVEVHGSIRTSSCPQCGVRLPLAQVVPLIEAGGGAPRCPACSAVLRPDVVFFDELLPEAIDRAIDLAGEARLLLVVGSSLEVYPVAALPQETLDAGGAVAVVNESPTWVDDRAALVVRGRAGEALADVVSHLRPVTVVEYDPRWPRAFDEERAHVAEALGELAVAIEHVGSTAVPGLAAKPVIDLLVGLATLELPPERITAMEALGYEYRGEYGISGRLFFRRGGLERTHHVHAVEHGGELWARHLAFRDYLRAHPDEATAYGEVKHSALAPSATAEGYDRAKQAYVEALAARASAWRGSR